MDIDHDVARWLLEFLLWQPLDDVTSKAVIRVLPPANDNPGMMKRLLLREMESEVSKGWVSEETMDLLEKFEEVDFEDGIEASEALRAAYCAVAVDCTLRFLKKEGEYVNGVKRIWRKRICKLQKVDNVGLVSEELWKWKDRIEEAVLDESVSVMIRSEGVDAVGAVKVFLKEAREKMGPPFLEYMAETLRSDDIVRELLLSEKKEEEAAAVGDQPTHSCPVVTNGSLMERNSTTHLDEGSARRRQLPRQWDDSRQLPPSPKRRTNVSPLNEHEIKKLTKRRQNKKWSSQEKDTLRAGVDKYGKGNWKLILNSYPDIFEERTEVDLKDKWRNMT